jgi:hypothetical protein
MRLLRRESDEPRRDTDTGSGSSTLDERTRHRHGAPEDGDPVDGHDRDEERRRDRPGRRMEREAPPTRRVRRERAYRPFHIGNILTVIAGGVLAVIGAVALVRTGIDRTWNSPTETVLDIDHTALLGAIEVGIGVVLILFGLSRSRILALVGCIALAIAAAIAAIEPGRLASDYALETWWAWTIAGVAALLALVLLLPSRQREVEETVDEPAVET